MAQQLNLFDARFAPAQLRFSARHGGLILATGLVPRLPTAVLAMGVAMISALSFACGLVLDSVARGRKEMKRLAYLSVPPPPGV